MIIAQKKKKVKKKVLFFIPVLAAALAAAALLTSCAGGDARIREEIGGRTFVWEKEGFGGDFTLTLNGDGSYSYYEGFLSSYMGSGEWTVKDGVLILNEESLPGMTFRFGVKNRELIFLSEGSSRFPYVSVEDGDRFLPGETE